MKSIFIYLLGVIRYYLDNLIDFVFGLYWERKKRSVPDLDKRHEFLTESATSLARRIKAGELKSEDLVRAVICRIKEVNPYINAVVEDRYDEALAEARAVDCLISAGISQEFSRNKPFLGVPFTSKECQAIKGLHLTLGMWKKRDYISDEDCVAVRRLKDAGAIPIATTNIPEMVLWLESRNILYGMTLNPHHTGRTPGGSSGGEAALAAVFGTPISLGSDVGGSIRIPAFYCGLFGHLPTGETTDYKGLIYRTGEEGPSMANLGFISRHAEDLAPLTKIISGDKGDHIDLERNIDIKDIKFYYLESSDDILLSRMQPELRDTLKKVLSRINEDLRVVNKPQPYTHDGFNNIFPVFDYWMSKEPEDIPLLFNWNNKEAKWYKEIFKKILGISKCSISAILILCKQQLLPIADSQWAENFTQEFRKDFYATLGSSGVLLMPSSPRVAAYHYEAFLQPFNFLYWAVVNVLKCPATQVPIGTNRSGLPLGIQVVAAPYRDDVCLTVAKYLEREFGGSILPCKVK